MRAAVENIHHRMSDVAHAEDAPDVDGLVYVTGDEYPLASGAITRCEIVATQDYDLIAVAQGKPF